MCCIVTVDFGLLEFADEPDKAHVLRNQQIFSNGQCHLKLFKHIKVESDYGMYTFRNILKCRFSPDGQIHHFPLMELEID